MLMQNLSMNKYMMEWKKKKKKEKNKSLMLYTTVQKFWSQ